jgi:hypothetical protein
MNIIVTLLFTHWVGDFVLQTHEQATKKSHSVKFLTLHTLTYFLALFVFCFVYDIHPFFAVINTILHWIVDFFTSKGTSYLWKKERYHDFFALVGLDQFIHISILLYTLNPLFI